MRAKDFVIKDFISVEEYNIVEDVVIIMRKYNQLNLPVVDEQNKLIGSVNARGILELVTREYHSLYTLDINPFDGGGSFVKEDLFKIKNKYIKDIMERKCLSVNMDDSMEYVANILLKGRQIVVPVVDNEMRVIGIINGIGALYEMLNSESESNSVQEK